MPKSMLSGGDGDRDDKVVDCSIADAGVSTGSLAGALSVLGPAVLYRRRTRDTRSR